MNLSENLKKIRKDNNLSQEQLAEKLGVSRQSVSKWESNLAYPEMDKVLQLCKIFNLNIDELLNQDIKEVKSKKEKKNKINIYMDDFLLFITKTLDMFTSMKFKEKIKCIFEQLLIIIILFLLFLFIGVIGNIFVQRVIGILPFYSYHIYSLIDMLYIIFALIFGGVIFVHIFKTRYLDYYVIIKNSKNSIDENKTLDESKKIINKSEEKIIIRDPNDSSYGFIKGLLKCVYVLVKVFVFLVALFFIFTLIFLLIMFVMSFLIIKSGLTFIGIIMALISCITINLIILYVIYNFIFDHVITNKNKIALIFISCVLIIGLGLGFIITSIKDFNFVSDVDSKYYISDINHIDMNDNLIIYNEVTYIEKNIKDIEIVSRHSKYYNLNIITDRNYVNLILDSNFNFLSSLNDFINNLNDKKVVDYGISKIYVYARAENIEKLKKNRDNYLKQNSYNF